MGRLDLSNMRIYSNTKEDTRDALDLIGEEVYFSDFKDFRAYDKGKLVDVSCNGISLPFLRENTVKSYKYILAKDIELKEGKEIKMNEEQVVKKIDVKNSLVFDKKMDNLKAAIEHLTEEGYFSNYEDFSIYIPGTLKSVMVSDGEDYPYATMYDSHEFNYFIPKDKAVFFKESKEKKYRPYVNSDELPFAVGDKLIYRCKNCCSECKGMVTEIEFQQKYPYEIDNIIIGGINVTPQELFDHYERLDNDCGYKPFGVEE